MYISRIFATVKTKGVVKRFESSFTYTIYIREYIKKPARLRLPFFVRMKKANLIRNEIDFYMNICLDLIKPN